MKWYVLVLMMGIAAVLAIAAGSGPAESQPAETLMIPTATFVPLGSRNTAWTPVIRARDGLDLVWVPAGCFLRGSEQGDDDEQPRREVCVSGFWLGRTEITNRQYARCVDAGACRPPHDRVFYDDSAYADHPVVYVDWEQASAYADWQGCSLPNEAQWEYAARGPEGWTYPWGNEFEGARLNFCDVSCAYEWRDPDYEDGYPESAPAGQYEHGASWVGALDLLGNVWEWAADWYDAGYYATLAGGVLDPPGPPAGLGRVVRGGSWASYRGYTRAASRDWDSPTLRFVVVGFRIACSDAGPGR